MGYYKDIFLKGKSICSNASCRNEISKKEYLYSIKKTGKPLCIQCKNKIKVKKKPLSKLKGFERYKILKDK